jgi:hypothetical protein
MNLLHQWIKVGYTIFLRTTMFGKAQWNVRKRQRLPVEAVAEEERPGFSIDSLGEQVLLPGQHIQFFILNGGDYPRWYRVFVTNLLPSEYSISTDWYEVDIESLIMLNPNERCDLLLSLKSDPEHPRTTPCTFEVIVAEYQSPDSEEYLSIYSRKEYQLVPPIDAQAIKVSAPRETIVVRPWHRAARIELTVTNRSYLPISVRHRLNLLDRQGKPLPLDGDGNGASEQMDAMEIQHRECLLPLTRRLQEPLQVQPIVEATVLGTGERIQRTMERPLQVVPVPFLKSWWPDWLIVGLALILLVGILFGFPPIYRPEARIRLHFDGLPEGQLPRGLEPRDLKVTIEVIDSRGVKRPYICLYRPYSDRGITGIEFYKRWGWEKRGLRFLWNPLNLSLRLEPDPKRDQTGRVSQLLKPYDLDRIQVDPNWMIDPAEPGVVPPIVSVIVPRKEKIEVIVPLPAGWPQEDTEIMVEARVNGAPSKDSPKRVSLSGGHPTQPVLPFDLSGQVEKGSEASVELIAKSNLSGYKSEGNIKVKPGLPVPAVKMTRPRPERPEYNLSISSEPLGAKVYIDGQEKGITPYESNAELPKGKQTITILIKMEGYEDYIIQKRVQAGQQVTVNAVLKPRKPIEPLPVKPPPSPNIGSGTGGSKDNKSITRWLSLLGRLDARPLFEQRSSLQVNIEIIPHKGREITLIVSANKPCWVQLYQCDPEMNKSEPLLGWDNLRGSVALYPKRRSPPLDEAFNRLSGKESILQISLMLDSETIEFVVVATTQLPPKTKIEDIQKGGQLRKYAIFTDSLSWLSTLPKGGEWAIGGAAAQTQ